MSNISSSGYSSNPYEVAAYFTEAWTRRLLTIADEHGTDEMLIYMRAYVSCGDYCAAHAPSAGAVKEATQ